ncbi:MAG: ABC transporter substrate-binding protein, partial [Sphaerospermopsis sp.]|nr:ABC transporter substrate-binding protein [Sphaerospermopsis sp.]
MSNISRRKFLITSGVAAATTIVAHGCSSDNSGSGTNSNSSTQISNTAKVETTKAKLGFIALTDSAPLIIAKEKGFFAKYGMT